MIEASRSPLCVELIKARHLSKLASITSRKRLAWLQLMVIRNWIAQVESILPSWLPARRPFCLLALENENPIALVVVMPCNRRATCWSVHFPELLSHPKELTMSFIKQNLLKNSMHLVKNKAQSWLIRCPASDNNQLAIARELGFQPLKLYNCWKPPSNILYNKSSIKPRIKHIDLEWQELNTENVGLLFRLEQASESSHLRQILDRNLADLVDPIQTHNRVLISKTSENNCAIAGLICRHWTENKLTIELIRDLAWDERISRGLESTLKELSEETDINIDIETPKDDVELTNLLNQIGWEFNYETILLGKSLWRRKENRRLIDGARKIESMLEGLNPQRPPLPSPTLDPK
ncbi:hypothetical protein [Prochlorococcus sp. MIT 1307]|uniref:hypothetical protein n=1 Tax=Prochlorococcus sp. MIT 1307 TaxID=3096219 RepID=UPI002A75A0E0|nr:hypothetical protein [Prochlorococcus sp. MIT 1307]